MTAVLWVLAVPTIAFGTHRTGVARPTGSTAHDLTPTLTTSVLGTGARPRRRPRHLRRLAAHRRARRPRPRSAPVAAHPDAEPALVEAEAIATHTPGVRRHRGRPRPGRPGPAAARPAAPASRLRSRMVIAAPRARPPLRLTPPLLSSVIALSTLTATARSRCEHRSALTTKAEK